MSHEGQHGCSLAWHQPLIEEAAAAELGPGHRMQRRVGAADQRPGSRPLDRGDRLPIIEVTDHCNLERPICIVDNQYSTHMSPETFGRILDQLVAREGSASGRVDSVISERVALERWRRACSPGAMHWSGPVPRPQPRRPGGHLRSRDGGASC